MRRDKALSITYAALKVIGVAGALAIVLVCPNIVQVFSLFEPNKKSKYSQPSRVNGTIQRLRENGDIELVKRNGVPCYALTEKGRLTLAKYELKHATIDKPKRWDNKWRMVIFDVREKRRHCRDAIREALRMFGFKHLQDSVWIHPYPCENIVELARTAYGVRHDAKYIVCQRFYGDNNYLGFFGLTDD
jgi:hypothetical protein